MTCIDLFAGIGGFTQAAEQAGHRVLWAANHNRQAVTYHERNHPGVQHACQDLQQFDFTQVPRHQIQTASPSCVGHTLSRGKDKPHHDAQRATAWAVVTAAEVHRPKYIVVENVPQFLAWKLYPAWQAALEALGYRLQVNLLDAADFGVPQNRVRVFIVCRLKRRPEPLQYTPTQHQAAAQVIDLNTGRWSRIEKPGRSQATLARIRQGRKQFGDEFVFPYYSKGSGLTGRSLDRPIGTLTTKARWGVVRGAEMRMLTVAETLAFMGFPSDYILPDSNVLAIHLLGNAVCPAVGEAILRQLK